MSIRRYFKQQSLQHVFQRSIDYGNFLYTKEDNIVLLTILYTYARQMQIDIMLLCFMPNHFHLLVDAPSKRRLWQYMDIATSLFVRIYNKQYSRKGKLLHNSFGSASKQGEKKIRSCFAYIGNNPVEKKLTQYASQYRWNLLPYYQNLNPFSEVSKRLSKRARCAMATIEKQHAANLYMDYSKIKEVTYKLNDAEKKYIFDYIISLYNPTNYYKAIGYFGSFKNMMIAFDSNTGSEYEIKEEYSTISDTPYNEMVEVLMKNNLWDRQKNPYTYTIEERGIAIELLREISGTTSKHISKFLHIKF